MSKTEPWIGSNIDGQVHSGLMFPLGAMLSEPASAAVSNIEIPITIAWAKLQALGDGARIASKRLWN